MARVLGLGGIFLKIADQDAWRAWYRDVLGVAIEDWGGAMFPHPDVGYTLVSAFAVDTDHFAPSTAAFMINLIVDDLDGVLAKAKSAGVEPLSRQDGEYGNFASLIDPAGIKVELWEPAAS